MTSKEIIPYKEFCIVYKKYIQLDKTGLEKLVKDVIGKPKRYCGIFRASTAKTKLLQHVTQSNEIKFGNIMEDMTTKYLEKLGYKNLDKQIIKKDKDTDGLKADQYYENDNDVYLVEMKVRDDHDGSKAKGQMDNFIEKVKEIRRQKPEKHIVAIMWFVDDSLHQKEKYYKKCLEQKIVENSENHLLYGGEYFLTLNGGSDAWAELCSHLFTHKKTEKELKIPDFGKSKEVLDILINLRKPLWEKLISDDPVYKEVREMIFSNGDNIEKANDIRKEKKRKKKVKKCIVKVK